MPDEPQCADRAPDNPSRDPHVNVVSVAEDTPASAEAGASALPVRNVRRVWRTLLVGALAAGGALWLQKAYWPRVRQERPPVRAEEMNERLFPVKSEFDWAAPPLPPGTQVQVNLLRGSRQQGDLRLQLMCFSPLSAAEVLAFYDAELAKAGWKKYNVPAEMATGAGGGLYRMGNLSLAVHALPLEAAAPPLRPQQTGCNFRFSVIMQPVPTEAPTGAPNSGTGQ